MTAVEVTPKLITKESAGLHRAIAAAHIVDGVVGYQAYMATSEDRYLLSVDQEAHSTAQDLVQRRLPKATPVVQRITARDVFDATPPEADVSILDDREPEDPVKFAHASIDTAPLARAQRQAFAGALVLRATQAHP